MSKITKPGYFIQNCHKLQAQRRKKNGQESWGFVKSAGFREIFSEFIQVVIVNILRFNFSFLTISTRTYTGALDKTVQGGGVDQIKESKMIKNKKKRKWS